MTKTIKKLNLFITGMALIMALCLFSSLKADAAENDLSKMRVTMTIWSYDDSGGHYSYQDGMWHTTYSGFYKTPNPCNVYAVQNGKKIKLDEKYFAVSYSNNRNAGTATLTLTGRNGYTGSVTKPFKIDQQNIAAYPVQSQKIADCIYSGGYKRPGISIKYFGCSNKREAVHTLNLKSGTDYSVIYSNNLNAGTATALVKGKGNYCGEITKTFTIKPASISNYKATLSFTSATYTGSWLVPRVTVKNSSGNTLSSVNYDVSYYSNVNAGTARVVITGKGNYTGTIRKTFTINPKQIKDGHTFRLSFTRKAYTGKEIKPSVSITTTDGRYILSSSNYTVTYINNIKRGLASVKITGKGNYTGIVFMTFKIT